MEIKDRDGRWHVYGYVVLPTGQRKRIRRSTGITVTGKASRALAAERAPEILRIAQLEAAGYHRPQGRTSLEKAVAQLVVQKELAGCAQPTIDIVLEKAAHLFAYWGPGKPVGSIDAEQLVRYAVHARADKGDIKGRAPGTVDRELRHLREAIRAAGLEPPPMPDLGKTYTPRERWLPPDEQRRLIMALTSHRRRRVVMHLHLGLSLSEPEQIRAEDIDWDAGDFGQVYVRGTKAESRARVVPLTPEAREALEWACANTTAGERLWTEWGNINRDLKAACVRAKIAPATSNDLRRSFATVHAIAGTPILTLMHMMGHTSTRMLEQVYARVGRGQHLHDAARALPRLSPSTRAKYVTDDAAKPAASDGDGGDQ